MKEEGFEVDKLCHRSNQEKMNVWCIRQIQVLKWLHFKLSDLEGRSWVTPAVLMSVFTDCSPLGIESAQGCGIESMHPCYENFLALSLSFDKIEQPISLAF